VLEFWQNGSLRSVKPGPSDMSSFFERQWGRVALFVAGFAAGLDLVWALGAWLVVLSGAERHGTGLDVRRTVAAWQAEVLNDHSQHRVAMVGDSMLLPEPGAPSLPERIGPLLRRAAPDRRATIHALSIPGLFVTSEYFVADDVVKARPDLIALELNARGLQPGVEGPKHAELAGWMDWGHIPEASLIPLGDAGITENRLLFYRLLVSLHLEAPWDALIGREARLVNSRDPFEAWVCKHVGGLTTSAAAATSAIAMINRSTFLPERDRGTPSWLRMVLGAALDGESTEAARLRVLGGTVRRFRDAGIPTLVWVSPMNTEHMESVGITLDGLERTMESTRAVVEGNGGVFFDFHAALEDSQFRDANDHFTLPGEHSGSAVLAPMLAQAILRVLSPSPPEQGDEKRATDDAAFK
jgi:hypothetical protein